MPPVRWRSVQSNEPQLPVRRACGASSALKNWVQAVQPIPKASRTLIYVSSSDPNKNALIYWLGQQQTILVDYVPTEPSFPTYPLSSENDSIIDGISWLQKKPTVDPLYLPVIGYLLGASCGSPGRLIRRLSQTAIGVESAIEIPEHCPLRVSNRAAKARLQRGSSSIQQFLVKLRFIFFAKIIHHAIKFGNIVHERFVIFWEGSIRKT